MHSDECLLVCCALRFIDCVPGEVLCWGRGQLSPNLGFAPAPKNILVTGLQQLHNICSVKTYSSTNSKHQDIGEKEHPVAFKICQNAFQGGAHDSPRPRSRLRSGQQTPPYLAPSPLGASVWGGIPPPKYFARELHLLCATRFLN